MGLGCEDGDPEGVQDEGGVGGRRAALSVVTSIIGPEIAPIMHKARIREAHQLPEGEGEGLSRQIKVPLRQEPHSSRSVGTSMAPTNDTPHRDAWTAP